MAEETEKKKKGIRLTERDLQIIRWINGHRAATADQVARKFALSAFTVKKRFSELKSLDYLVYKKLFHDQPGVYMAGVRGIAAAGDELPAAKLSLGSYAHDLQLVDLAVTLERKTGAHWHTDRQIRHDKGLKGVGAPGHSPDGILLFPGGDMVAVELELSPKGAGKIEKILKEYARRLYREVWYFVNSDYLAARIRTAALPFIRVFSWPDPEERPVIENPRAIKALLAPTAIEEERKAARDWFACAGHHQTDSCRRLEEEEQKIARDFFWRKGRDTDVQ